MATCKKEVEIETSTKKNIDVVITVDGYLDQNYGQDADGNRGEPTWFVDGWQTDYDEEGLTAEEKSEIEERVEEIVMDESWDFENAKEEDEEEFIESED